MSGLISHNFRAHEPLRAGEIAAYYGGETFDPEVARATAFANLLGVVAQDADAGKSVVINSFVEGQYCPVLLGAHVTIGQRLALNNQGYILANGASNSATLPLVAMENGNNGQLIQAVCCPIAGSDLSQYDGNITTTGAITAGEGQYIKVLGCPNTQNNVVASFGADAFAYKARGDSRYTLLYYKDIKAAVDNAGGGLTLESLFASEPAYKDDGTPITQSVNGQNIPVNRPAVGSLAVYQLQRSNGVGQAFYGEEVVIDAHITAQVAGRLSVSASTPSYDGLYPAVPMPAGTKLRVLSGVDTNKDLVLAIRTA